MVTSTSLLKKMLLPALTICAYMLFQSSLVPAAESGPSEGKGPAGQIQEALPKAMNELPDTKLETAPQAKSETEPTEKPDGEAMTDPAPDSEAKPELELEILDEGVIPFIESPEHREDDFIGDADAFNRQLRDDQEPPQTTADDVLNNRWREFLEKAKQNLSAPDARTLALDEPLEWRDKRAASPFYRLPDRPVAQQTAQDDLYLNDKGRLDQQRLMDWEEYHAQRDDLQNNMVNYDRASDEYLRLKKAMRDLDRRQAALERGYERKYRDLDVDYSLGRW